MDVRLGRRDKTSESSSTNVGNLQVQASANGASWLTTIAGRFGYGMDRWLVYGKGGWAWLESSAQIRNLTTGAFATADHTGSGWSPARCRVRSDAELTTKLEYNYVGSGSWSSPNNFIAGGNASYKAHIHTLVVGINYKF